MEDGSKKVSGQKCLLPPSLPKKSIMSSSTITPPSSTITPKKMYDVFLSFRGPDTRHGLISHLNKALSQKQIRTFIDEELERGDKISPALLKLIQESMIAVVIFSKDYASSTSCLIELAEIMKREKSRELTVIPVFYNVDPSDVLNQTGPFEHSFAKHENDSPKEVLEWREAFTEASNIAGWPYDGTRSSESRLVREIVEDVNGKLMSICSSPGDFKERRLIGIDKRIARVMPLLCLDTMDVRIIGIWGMVGVGKSTLADAVFSQISGKFEGVCFKRNVRGRIEALDGFEHEVVSNILNDKNLKSAMPTILNTSIRVRLKRQKVLIVFEDVSTFLPLEPLVDVFKLCGLGSRMIVTSRDKQVLTNFVDNHDHIYEVDGLDRDEARDLLHEYAFKKNPPTEDLIELSKEILCYVEGNPRALKELGLSLQGRHIQEWESTLDNLQGSGDSKIFNVLNKNCDGLNVAEKTYFLEIACFFNSNPIYRSTPPVLAVVTYF